MNKNQLRRYTQMSHSFVELFKETESLALSLGHRFMSIDHLTVTVLKLPSIIDALNSMSISPKDLEDRIITHLKNTEFPDIPISTANAIDDDQAAMSIQMARIMQELSKRAVMEQLKTDDYTIAPYFVLFECLSFPNSALEAALVELGVSRTEVARALQKYVETNEPGIQLQKTFDEPTKEGKRVAQQHPQSKQKGIEDYTTNLTELAKQGKLDPMIGRTAELQNLIEILSRKTKKNACLAGEAGVGKTQIIDGLAQAIVDGNVPEHLQGVELLSLNMGSFTAGTKYRGEFEERVDDFLTEMKKRPDTIIFIDELHTIMGAGASSSGTMDMSNLLKPALSRGEIRMIGATTYEEYRKHIEKDGALARRFMKVDVLEPTFSETREIVEGVKSNYENFHGVVYSTEAIDEVMNLSNKFLQNKRFPDKAIDLLDASAALKRTNNERDNFVKPEHVQTVVARIANLDVSVVACNESERMTNLPEALRSRVFGQEEAVQKLVDNVMVARAGLREKASVQGAFIFQGPSGTGKTEIAKALADAMGSELIRFDMSEFSQEHTVSKLIGSPPGYVGHESGNGLLLDKVEQFPNCVLLLDEIEKAHPNILLTFLQVLDEGRLTGSQGKTVYFNNVTVIMTTNLGAKQAQVRAIGGTGGDDGMDKALKSFLRPEFLNRIDSVVKFNELSTEAIDAVISKFMASLNDSVAGRGVKVKLTDEAVQWFAKNGVQVGMGARPMKRAIEQNIRVPLAKEMLCGSLQNGGTITFDVIEGKIGIKPKRAAKKVEA